MAIKKLLKWKKFLGSLAKKINELIDHTDCLDDIQGRNGIKVTTSPKNIIIDGKDLLDRIGSGGNLPTGAAGDMLYHDGTGWLLLTAPTGMTVDPVMRFSISGSAPYWEEPSGC